MMLPTLYCVTMLMWAEGSIADDKYRIMAAQTAVHRLSWNDPSLCGVIMRPWQYATTYPDRIRHGLYECRRNWNQQLWRRIEREARHLREYPDMTGGATHFHRDDVVVKWVGMCETAHHWGHTWMKRCGA